MDSTQNLKNISKKIVAVEDIDPPRDHLFRVEWNLGPRCNYDCSYCSPNIHNKKSEHLNMEVIEKTVDRIATYTKNHKKKTRISLTGGEPYLHPRFFDIIKMIKDSGIQRISVTSNASMPAKTYIKSLEYVNYLILSIHFEFAKLEKVKEKVLEIRSALTENRNLHLHIMAIPGKVNESLELAQLMKDENVSFALRRVRPQFDENGLYLMPFNSGQSGGHGPKWSKIKDSNLHYYSEDELQRLGAFK